MFDIVFATVLGTVFGVMTGIILAIFRDKKVVIKLGKIISNDFAKAVVNSPVLMQALVPLINLVLGLSHTKPTTPDNVQASVDGNIMTIPFVFRRRDWKLMIQYDASKSDTEVKWIADGNDLGHCPMIPFLLTKDELGVNELLVKEEEEIDI